MIIDLLLVCYAGGLLSGVVIAWVILICFHKKGIQQKSLENN